MNCNLKEQITENGFLIIENFIDEEFNHFLKTELMKIINSSELLDSLAEIYFENNDSKKIFMIGDLLAVSEKFLPLLNYEPLLNLLTNLFGNQDFIFQFLQAIIKNENNGREVKWHRDFPNKAITYLNSDLFRIIICLDGLNNNGEIQILEGSHKISDTKLKQSQNVKAKDMVSSSKIKNLRCSSGSIIILNPKLIHRSLENNSDSIRCNLIMEWSDKNNIVISGEKWNYQYYQPNKQLNI